jgi:putative oxidoreductase
MADENAIQKICRMALKILGSLSFLPPLVSRVVIGWGFHLAGKGKLDNIDKAVSNFTNMGIAFPEFNARFIGGLECYGGLLLLIGLFSRPIAALLGATMVVALATAHRGQVAEVVSSLGDPTDILPLMFGPYLLWLLVYGPGFVSIDALIRKWIGVDKKEAA